MSLTSPALRLRGRRVVLASASPRRKEILGLTGVAFEVVPPRFPETLSKTAWPRPQDYARETATGKAKEVAARLVQEDPETPTIVIGADTVVAVDGRILEKPRDREDALRMLRSLSGKQHRVITGVAIVTWGSCGGPAQEVTAFHEETRVTFSPLSEELIREYVDSGEGWDKAGAYAIQARGAMLVQGVAGDVLNAVGFPLNRFCRELARVPPTRTGSEVSAGAGQPGQSRGTGSGVRGTGNEVSGTGSDVMGRESDLIGTGSGVRGTGSDVSGTGSRGQEVTSSFPDLVPGVLSTQEVTSQATGIDSKDGK